MPTREADRLGVAPAAKQVAEHASALARLEMELAGLELKAKVASLGLGAGLLIGAALFGLFAIGFGLTTIAVALSLVLDTWLALLIVFGSLLLLVHNPGTGRPRPGAEGHAARAGAGHPGGQVDHRGIEEQWALVTDAARRTSAATSPPSGTSSRRLSKIFEAGSARRRTLAASSVGTFPSQRPER